MRGGIVHETRDTTQVQPGSQSLIRRSGDGCVPYLSLRCAAAPAAPAPARRADGSLTRSALGAGTRRAGTGRASTP